MSPIITDRDCNVGAVAYTSDMPKRSRKKPAQDFNQLARSIVDRATGTSAPKKKHPPKKQDAADIARADSEGMGQPQGTRPKRSPKKAAAKKNPAAVALGRMGGLKGGPARAAKLTKAELSESAKKAAQARWSSHKK
jgi:hypothetical protein